MPHTCIVSSSYSGELINDITPLCIRFQISTQQCQRFDIIDVNDFCECFAEFLLLGSSTVQVCTAVMAHGFRIVEDMAQGLSDYMDEKGFEKVSDIVNRAIVNYGAWNELDLNYRHVAEIHPQYCIGCNRCVVACLDGGHQCIELVKQSAPVVKASDCVGCNLCELVCPAPRAITMVSRP